MGSRLFIAGVLLAIFFPLVSAITGALHMLMGCSGGGSSGPVGGCSLLGLQFNFPANLATPAAVVSFVTVPLGLLLCILGLIVMAVSAWRRQSRVFETEKPKSAQDESEVRPRKWRNEA